MCQGGDEEEGDSSAPAEVEEGGDQDEDEDAGDVFEEAEDAADEAAADVVDKVESTGGGGDGGGSGGDGGGSGGGGFFKPLFGKRAKTGNKRCSWSWKERRCQPAALCQYKYQASFVVACLFCVLWALFFVVVLIDRWRSISSCYICFYLLSFPMSPVLLSSLVLLCLLAGDVEVSFSFFLTDKSYYMRCIPTC